MSEISKARSLGQIENVFWKNLPDIFPKKYPDHHVSDVIFLSLARFVRDASAIFDLNRRSSVSLRRKNSKNLHLYFIFSRQALHPALTVWRKCYLVYYFFMGCSKRKKRTLWANHAMEMRIFQLVQAVVIGFLILIAFGSSSDIPPTESSKCYFAPLPL